MAVASEKDGKERNPTVRDRITDFFGLIGRGIRRFAVGLPRFLVEVIFEAVLLKFLGWIVRGITALLASLFFSP